MSDERQQTLRQPRAASTIRRSPRTPGVICSTTGGSFATTGRPFGRTGSVSRACQLPRSHALTTKATGKGSLSTDLLGNAVNVTYSGHHWPGYRYSWSRLEARGITDGGHPKVFVAYGSHASYPVPCVGDHRGLLGACDQRDYRYHLKKGLIDLELKLSDGRHDGKGAWLANLDDLCRDRHCLAALPVAAIANSLAGTRQASWNAYDGLWGRAQCSVTTAFCLRIDGPQSPGLQRRFENPSLGVEGSDDSLIPR